MTRTGMNPETLTFYQTKLHVLRQIKREIDAEIAHLKEIVKSEAAR